MVNELKVFENKELGFTVRCGIVNNKEYFVATDIARALGYSIPSKAVNTHCKGVSKMEAPTNGGIQELLFIPEGDMYRLIVRSKLPSAQKFESWVMDEVLPTIRKTGGSVVSGREEQFINTYFTSFSDETKLKMVDDLRTQNNKLKESLAKNEPYISFGKAIESSEDNIMIGAYAKLLSNAGISFGRNSLFKWLRNNGYLLKQVGERNNPREQYLKQGIFAISQDVADTNYGKKITQTTKITGKGQLYLLEKIVNNLHIKSVKISNKLNEFLYDCYVKNGAKTNMELKLMATNPSAHEEEWLSVREMLLNIQGNEDLVIEVDDILEY